MNIFYDTSLECFIEDLKELSTNPVMSYSINQKYARDILRDIEQITLENQQLKEELQKCTRKHWQQKSAEHYMNEKIYKERIDKAIEFIKTEYNTFPSAEEWRKALIEILKGDNND